MESLRHFFEGTGGATSSLQGSRAVDAALKLARIAPLALMTGCGGCDGTVKIDQSDSVADSGYSGDSADSNVPGDSSTSQDSGSTDSDVPGDSSANQDSGSTDSGIVVEVPETTSSAADCAARLEIDIRDVAIGQFVDSLGAPASLTDGVFRDSNFQLTGGDAADPVFACVYTRDGTSAAETRVYRGEGNLVSVEADIDVMGSDVLALRFTTLDGYLVARSDSANAVWTYEVSADGGVTDTSL